MIVYRITKWHYLEDLSGTGAQLYGGRWNREGFPMVYCASHLSLAVLEHLANNDRKLANNGFGFIALEIPDDQPRTKIDISTLNKSWRNASYSTQTVETGTKWIEQRLSLTLHVPSAVLEQEYNVLINPHHVGCKDLKILKKDNLNIDGRIM